jgi:hypothetical protein
MQATPDQLSPHISHCSLSFKLRDYQGDAPSNPLTVILGPLACATEADGEGITGGF